MLCDIFMCIVPVLRYKLFDFCLYDYHECNDEFNNHVLGITNIILQVNLSLNYSTFQPK